MKVRFPDSLEEALCWCGVGDVGVVGVAVGRSVEVALAAAIMQGDPVISCLITAARHTLNPGALHLGHTEERRNRRHTGD